MWTALGEVFKILVPPLFEYVTFRWMTDMQLYAACNTPI